MSIQEYHQRNVVTALVRETADWGVSVSEKKVRKAWTNTALVILSAVILFASLIFVLPLIAGLMLNAEIDGILLKVGIVSVCLALAAAFNIHSRRGPRNALEVDHEANELRLGSMNRYGAFVRHRVIPLANVDDALVHYNTKGAPELQFIADGEEISISLADAKPGRLIEIATQVRAAADHARNAPRRSRIRSAVAGISASYREVGNRVVSRFH